jgi:hypothetical protein
LTRKASIGRDRQALLLSLGKLTDKQFAEVFYEAVADRDTSDRTDGTGHFVLADAHGSTTEPWTVDLIGLPSAESRAQEWVDDAPICQAGECAACGFGVRSWAKAARCPICFAAVTCS